MGFDVETYIQGQCAEYLRWLPDDIVIEGNSIHISGWALAVITPADEWHILLNGKPFANCEWPVLSASLDEFFDRLPAGAARRYRCSQKFDNLDSVFEGGFARFSFVHGTKEDQRTYRSAWYFPDPREVTAVPDEERIARVIYVKSAKPFLWGGATMFKRYDSYLQERFGRPMGEFPEILDWGCGCGRLTRFLAKLPNSRVTGVDIDHDNTAWCRENIPNAAFIDGPLNPPIPVEDGRFDLLIGTSVFTHLPEEIQFLWLDELRRVSRKGAILLMSIHGAPQLALYKFPPELYVDIERKGFLLYGENNQLNNVITDKKYYNNVGHSQQYILDMWGNYFEIIDIIPAIASNQNLVVMRRR